MTYEKLLLEAENEGIEVFEKCSITGRVNGLCVGESIFLNKKLENDKDKKCILAEELGHYHTSYGNIINQLKVGNRQQERKARVWAYKKLIPLEMFIEAYKAGVKNQFELAEFLDVTEQFLLDAIKYYKEKHGLYYILDDYIIYFEPLGILENFEGR